MICSTGDDLEHEQDTVLQLQEVIEQLRNVFPSEPGESHGSGKQTVYNSVDPQGRRDGVGEEGRGANTHRRGRADRKIKGQQRGGVGIE